jgi:hypothetical protein
MKKTQNSIYAKELCIQRLADDGWPRDFVLKIAREHNVPERFIRFPNEQVPAIPPEPLAKPGVQDYSHNNACNNSK